MIVPIIAGVWPFIRNLLNQYNQIVENAAETAKEAAIAIKRSISSMQAVSESTDIQRSVIYSELARISERLGEISQNFTFMLHETNMPVSFALAFLASLFAAIGHFFYQAFCPQPVKDYDLAGYSSEKVAQYSNNRSKVTLSEAAEYVGRRLNSSSEQILSSVEGGDFDAIATLRKISVQNAEISSGESQSTDKKQRSPSQIQPNEATDWGEPNVVVRSNYAEQDSEQALIDVASRVSYSEMLTERLGAGIIALLLYSACILILLVIVGRQMASVFAATGWM